MNNYIANNRSIIIWAGSDVYQIYASKNAFNKPAIFKSIEEDFGVGAKLIQKNETTYVINVDDVRG